MISTHKREVNHVFFRTALCLGVVFSAPIVASEQRAETSMVPREIIQWSESTVASNGQAFVAERNEQIRRLVKFLDGLKPSSGTYEAVVQCDIPKNTLGENPVFYRDPGIDTEDSRLSAIRLLGTLRADEAVPVLLRCLSLKYGREYPHVLGGKPPPRNEALIALVKIGKPSSKAALERLKRCGEDDERSLLVEVIKGVEGAELARLIFRKAVTDSQDAKEKKTLQMALDLLGRDGRN